MKKYKFLKAYIKLENYKFKNINFWRHIQKWKIINHQDQNKNLSGEEKQKKVEYMRNYYLTYNE